MMDKNILQIIDDWSMEHQVCVLFEFNFVTRYLSFEFVKEITNEEGYRQAYHVKRTIPLSYIDSMDVDAQKESFTKMLEEVVKEFNKVDRRENNEGF